MTITENTTLADIAAALPSSVPVFQRHGIDFCCGGKRAIGAVCAEQGLSFDELARAIEASAAAPSGENRDWTREPLHALIDHIVTTYHDPLRSELPRLGAMARKVAGVHGAKAGHLARMEAIVAELAEDLLEHMKKEEQVLFPAIRAIEDGAGYEPTALLGPVSVMEREHDRAGELLGALRRISGQYEVPDWGCQTFRAFYQGLEGLERSMHVHVHLENNILFPRALRQPQ